MTERKRKRNFLDEDLPVRHDRDTGCDWHPACLTCPFPECRYDVDERRLAKRAAS